VDRDDGCPGPEISVADQCVQLSPGFYQPRMDECKSFTLLGRVMR
jgi:hypothetical protein